ncbi:hypothetical protein GO986_21745 [Deinococcus sp. HMF7620]|uniref:Uncharacterized protein n=1 Tax=Deinococcus arboris TaxID=2682977 RepID=A0A7C9M4V2_9DEIO|nr:hypothetical protein [Deinococcus arboris]MVN89362.1 hypothetical protein [Deinococcus arboris]
MTPVPVPVLAAGVAPRAAKSFCHVAGAIDGARTNYADMNALAWFTGGGWDLRNGRRMRPRGLSGGGDTDEAQRR